MAKKYIDAEKLKVIIKRRIRLEELNFAALGGGGQTICINTLEWVSKQIDFLQQEQLKKPQKDCNGCPHCVDRKDQYGWHFKGCFGGPYNGKFIAEIDECPLKQEESTEVDLEKLM